VCREVDEQGGVRASRARTVRRLGARPGRRSGAGGAPASGRGRSGARGALASGRGRRGGRSGRRLAWLQSAASFGSEESEKERASSGRERRSSDRSNL
jgi:hypothetical protein